MDEVRAWSAAGVDLVVSLLTADEVADLELEKEREWCQTSGIQFLAFPIPDRGVPASAGNARELVSHLASLLSQGKSIAIHCRQGIGRAALIAIAVLIHSGVDEASAVNQVSESRQCAVPETLEQRRWITAFAAETKAFLPKVTTSKS